ncbi:hypothetical protein PHMEG_00015722, partial [Phytophthora megakarya]
KSPLLPSMPNWIAQQVNLDNAQHRLFLGAALLGYYFLLRSSEYLYVKGGRHRYALQVRDVQVLDHDGKITKHASDAVTVQVTLRVSKTDQRGQGTTRSLRRSGHKVICSVKAAVMLLEHADKAGLDETDPICSWFKKRMIRATVMTRLIKCAARATGKDPAHYSSHSMRSGGATSLLSARVEVTTIKLHGRWSSSAFERYTRYTRQLEEPLAKLMAPKSSG